MKEKINLINKLSVGESFYVYNQNMEKKIKVVNTDKNGLILYVTRFALPVNYNINGIQAEIRFNNVGVYKFKLELLEKNKLSYKLKILDDVKKLQRREAFRVSKKQNINIKIIQENIKKSDNIIKDIEGFMTDISIAGLGCFLDTEIFTGQNVVVELRLDSSKYSFQAEVIRIDARNEKQFVGFMFVNMERKKAVKLSSIIAKEQRMVMQMTK